MLSLVPPTEPSPKEAVKQRLQRNIRPDGMIECNRCGCRTAVTVINGATVNKGRVQGGTVIQKLICDECRKQGVITPMLPELRQI